MAISQNEQTFTLNILVDAFMQNRLSFRQMLLLFKAENYRLSSNNIQPSLAIANEIRIKHVTASCHVVSAHIFLSKKREQPAQTKILIVWLIDQSHLSVCITDYANSSNGQDSSLIKRFLTSDNLTNSPAEKSDKKVGSNSVEHPNDAIEIKLQPGLKKENSVSRRSCVLKWSNALKG